MIKPQKSRTRLAVMLLPFLAVALAAQAATVGTVTEKRNYVTVEITENGDTEDFRLFSLVSCTVWSPTSDWDSANIDLETYEPVTGNWKDVGVAAFVNMTADVDWTSMEGGFGAYRFEIESSGGSSDVVAHCRKVR